MSNSPSSSRFFLNSFLKLRNQKNLITFLTNLIWPYKKDFQTPATAEMFGIINLHNHIMFIVLFIVVFVLVMIYQVSLHYTFDNGFGILYRANIKIIKSYDIKFRHHSLLEFIWTVIPTLILLSVVIPSFALLYSFELFDMGFDIVIKATGHQWYWSYEVSTKPGYSTVSVEDISNFDKHTYKVMTIEFDSYMVPTDELESNQPRLLATTEPLLIPNRTKIKLLVTSDDVLHSWTIPAFGCKMDACPGRLNQIFLNVSLKGIYYGQCSELCGVNHGFMPIEVKVVNHRDFYTWMVLKDELEEAKVYWYISEHLNQLNLMSNNEDYYDDYEAEDLITDQKVKGSYSNITEFFEKSNTINCIKRKEKWFWYIQESEKKNLPPVKERVPHIGTDFRKYATIMAEPNKLFVY